MVLQIFLVYIMFLTPHNFIRFLNFNIVFVEVNVNVSYDGNRNLSELINKSEPGSNGSNKNAILVFLFFTSSFFHLLKKQKPDVRVKMIPLAIFFFLGSYVRHLQHATPYHEINVCSQSLFFTFFYQ